MHDTPYFFFDVGSGGLLYLLRAICRQSILMSNIGIIILINRLIVFRALIIPIDCPISLSPLTCRAWRCSAINNTNNSMLYNNHNTIKDRKEKKGKKRPAVPSSPPMSSRHLKITSIFVSLFVFQRAVHREDHR